MGELTRTGRATHSLGTERGVLPRSCGHFRDGSFSAEKSVLAKRKKYSEEFKREAVGLTRQPGASVSQVARDIVVGAKLLFRLRRQLGEKGEAFPGAGVARDQELLALKRELAKVKRERDFLRDAAAYFASESK